jgi:hypothetical protein
MRPQAATRPKAAMSNGVPASGSPCKEGGLKFWVNFRDYLDTGLFLDHRLVRGMLRDWARGGDFLNLFCYTGERHRIRGGRRRAQHGERRPIEHLPRLGARITCS